MCTATRLNWNSASKKKRQRSKCIKSISLHDLEASTATTAWLSLWNWMQRPNHHPPQTVAATTMERSSCVAMFIVLISGTLSHHSVSQCAPQPQLSEASDVKVLSGAHSPATDSRVVPFHPSKNECHHNMSDHASLFTLKWYVSFMTDLLREIR